MKTNKTIFLAVLLMTALFTLTCDRYVDSSEPVRSLPEFSEIPQITSVKLGANSVLLSWKVSSSTGIKSYRIFVYDSSFATGAPDQTPLSTYETPDTEIELTDLIPNRIYRLQVAAISSMGFEGNRSETVSVRPTYFSLEINRDAEYTTGTTVSVGLSTPLSATHMMISEDSTFSGRSFVPFQASSTFDLSEGDGTKWLYARLQFADGSQTDGFLRDSIVLDTEVDINEVKFTPGSWVAGKDSVLFQVVVGETGGEASVSFGSISNMPLYDDGTHGDSALSNGVYSSYFNIPESFSITNGVVRGSFTDKAGNNIIIEADTTLTILQKITLHAWNFSDTTAYLHWTTSNSSAFVAYRVHRSLDMVSIDSKPIATITDRATAEFTDDSLSTGKYYYKIIVYDQFDNLSKSNIDSVSIP